MTDAQALQELDRIADEGWSWYMSRTPRHMMGGPVYVEAYPPGVEGYQTARGATDAEAVEALLERIGRRGDRADYDLARAVGLDE